MKHLDPRPFILVGGFFLVLVLVHALYDWSEAGIMGEALRLALTAVLFLTFAYLVTRLIGGYH